MTAELPVVCTLSETELPARLAEMAELGREALVDVRVDAGRARLRFADGAEILRRVEAIAAAESRCCAFLKLGVTSEDEAVVLTISAPDGAEGVLRELVDAFGERSYARERTRKR